ncbi:MAG TPA: hypothetical protein VF104_08665, partial [Burkholderiales bacterium]
MRVLLLTHSFNSLAQRLYVELAERGHEVSVELDIAELFLSNLGREKGVFDALAVARFLRDRDLLHQLVI